MNFLPPSLFSVNLSVRECQERIEALENPSWWNRVEVQSTKTKGYLQFRVSERFYMGDYFRYVQILVDLTEVRHQPTRVKLQAQVSFRFFSELAWGNIFFLIGLAIIATGISETSDPSILFTGFVVGLAPIGIGTIIILICLRRVRYLMQLIKRALQEEV